MQASRFNYPFSVDGKKYIFNSISEAIILLPEDETFDITNNSAILSRFKMQVESTEHDFINLEQKINAISKAFGNVADLNIIVTDQCNLQCPGCFNCQSIHSGEDFSQLLISLKHRLVDLCNFYDQRIVKKVSISLSGGEPLLFKERVSSVIEVCESILGERAHDYLIMTNGTLLTHDIICQLNDLGLNDYYISVDSNRYTLSEAEYNGLSHRNTSFQALCVNAKLIYTITGKKPVLRFNINSSDDTFTINAMKMLDKNGLRSMVILDFKRWYNETELDNYYESLPGQIKDLVLAAHNLGFECLWRWQDNIDKYLACRVDTGFGVTIHPNGEPSICPYTFDDVKAITGEREKCKMCNFFPICFGGCNYKSHSTDRCDYKMIEKALETHVLASR